MANNLGNGIQSSILDLILNARGITGIADNTVTSPLTNLYVSLHTANPTNAGNQTSSEVTYIPYARVAIARSATGAAWGITGSSPTVASPISNIVFPSPTGATGQVVTYVGIGTSVTGAGQLVISGVLSPSVTITDSVAPVIATTSQVTMD